MTASVEYSFACWRNSTSHLKVTESVPATGKSSFHPLCFIDINIIFTLKWHPLYLTWLSSLLILIDDRSNEKKTSPYSHHSFVYLWACCFQGIQLATHAEWCQIQVLHSWPSLQAEVWKIEAGKVPNIYEHKWDSNLWETYLKKGKKHFLYVFEKTPCYTSLEK